MILLQAAIGAGFLLTMLLGLFLLIGIPILTTALMKLYKKTIGKKDNIRSGKAHSKDIIPIVSIFVFSVVALLLLFYMLILLFDNFFPA